MKRQIDVIEVNFVRIFYLHSETCFTHEYIQYNSIDIIKREKKSYNLQIIFNINHQRIAYNIYFNIVQIDFEKIEKI